MMLVIIYNITYQSMMVSRVVYATQQYYAHHINVIRTLRVC